MVDSLCHAMIMAIPSYVKTDCEGDWNETCEPCPGSVSGSGSGLGSWRESKGGLHPSLAGVWSYKSCARMGR